MTNVSKLTSADEAERELEVTDFVLGRLAKDKQSAFNARLSGDQSLLLAVQKEVEFGQKLNNAADSYTVSEQALAGFNQSLVREEKAVISETGINRSGTAKTGMKKYNGDQSIWTASHFVKYGSGIASAFLLIGSFLFLSGVDLGTNNSDENQTGFETLTNGAQQLIENNQGLLYSVVFASGLDQLSRQKVASQYGFEIISGPGQGNAYIIKVKQPLSNVEQGLLRDTEQIVFIETAVMSSDNQNRP